VEARGIEVKRFKKKSRVVRVRNEEWEEKRFREKRSLKCCHSLNYSSSLLSVLCEKERKNKMHVTLSNSYEVGAVVLRVDLF